MCGHARVAELADAQASGACVRKDVGVQVPPRAQLFPLQGSPSEWLTQTLLTGGYPRIFGRGLDPSDLLASYIATYIERDMRTIANTGDLVAFQRFLQLYAGRTGQLLNYSALASDWEVSQP